MAQKQHGASEREACRALNLSRSSPRYIPVKRADEDKDREEIIYLAANFGRVGYRMVCYMMRNSGRLINHKKVERIWREEGLKLPQKQPKKRRLWMNDGSCVRLRPDHKNHVWSYDFIEDKLSNGRRVRWLNIIDEFEHICLASIPQRSWGHKDIIDILSGLFIMRGNPEYLRSDNGSEFTAKKLMQWLSDVNVATAYIEPGSPWENAFIESFNSRMRDEFLNGEIFDTMHEVRVLTRRWVDYYNNIRPHRSLGGRPPAPQTNTFPGRNMLPSMPLPEPGFMPLIGGLDRYGIRDYDATKQGPTDEGLS
jgi:putative transposase